MVIMSFEVYPILDPGQKPTQGVWYAVAPEGGQPTSEDAAAGPCPRVGANANYLQVEKHVGMVLLSAGATPEGPFADLHQLRVQKDKMEWVSVAAEGLPPRYEHASFIAQSPSDRSANLYVFAGANNDKPVSDVWKLNLEGMVWKEEKVSGSIPVPRTYHSSSSLIVERDELIIYSGGSEGVTPVGDQAVHVFNQRTGEWSTPVTSGSPPPPRQGHVAAVVGSKLFIHGGMAGEDVLSDLYCLDLDTFRWSCPEVGGVAPSPLAAHGCGVVGAAIYMFGGLSPAGPGACDVLYCLDTDSLTWQKLSISGAPPPARLDHAMCAIKIPVVPNSGQVPPEQAYDAEREDTIDACEARSLVKKDASISCTSFQAVTITDPEVATPLGLADAAEREDTLDALDACEKRTLVKKDASVSCTSFQAVTIIDPEVATPLGLADAAERKDTLDACEARSLNKKDKSISCTSFQAVNFIGPEAAAVSSFSPPTAAPVEQVSAKFKVGETGTKAELEPGKASIRAASGAAQDSDKDVEWISALFVFGGMDTAGNIHGDSFILVP